MSVRRGVLAWTTGVFALSLGLAAHGQDAAVARPKRAKPPAAAAPLDAAAPRPTGPDVAGALARPLPGAERLRVAPPASGAPTLRSALSSRWSAPATIASRGGGQCRAACATSRLACLAPGSDDETSRCNAAWTRCLSSCAGLAYGRAPSPAPP